MTNDELVEKVAEAIFETEYPKYSPTASPDSNRWSWRGDGNAELHDEYRMYARAAIEAMKPASPCELCHGYGTVAKAISGPRMAGTINQPCPNGCSPPTLQNSARGAAGVPEQAGQTEEQSNG